MSEMQASDVHVENGTCYVLFAYHVGLAIDLDEVDTRIENLKQRAPLRHKRPAPQYLNYRPAPIRVTQTATAFAIGSYHSNMSVDLVLYDFGAVSVVYQISLTGPLANLSALSAALYDNAFLLIDSRTRVEELCANIRAAIDQPEVSELVEDYVVLHIETFTQPCTIQTFCANYSQEIAQILRAEKQLLSEQEVRDVLSQQMSFGVDDVTIVDWHAALVIDRNGDDIRAVLEFANVELLEMRYLDQRLDDALDRAYDTLSTRLGRKERKYWSYRADLREVAQLQVDSAILFEEVNNALKLVGDQYLARVYRLISRRFHLEAWDASILRKLQTLESIYNKMADQASSHRMEVLEWIIIILIAVSLVLPFIPGMPGH